MGMLASIAKLTAQTAGVLLLESYGAKYLAATNPEAHAALYGIARFSLPKAFALVILVNLVACSFTVITLSFKVSAAREKCGVPLPAMYATGTDAKSRKFNCVQRGHQQALETFPMFLVASIVGGVKFPVSVSLFGAVWCKARFAWAEGYASGDPKKRYGNAWAKLIWTTLVGTFAAATGVALEVAELLSFWTKSA